MATDRNYDERFQAWCRDNPQTVLLFLRYARRARDAGMQRYGIKAIAERVRWHVVIERRGADFKINNNYMSRLARLLVRHDPTLRALFEFRGLKTQ